MRYVLFLLAIGVSHSLFAQQPKISTAVDYLSFIGNQYSEISNDMMAYTSAAAHRKNARKVEKKRLELIQTMKTAIQNMSRLPGYKGDVALRDSVLNYFRISLTVLNEDYEKIVNLEEVAEQSYDQMEAYMLMKEKASEKEQGAAEKASREYKAFAAKNNIRLIETESNLSKKIEESNAVMKYYNQVYLVFFKSYNAESHLMDALNKKDVGAMEQTKNSLASATKEGLDKASKLPSFKEDGSMKKSCYDVLNFYNYEADHISELIDFYLKQENFEKLRKAMEAKRQSDRTQADVDRYNKSVSEYNAAINQYNKLNTELNKRRSAALELWNKTTDHFLDEHTPKHR